MLDEGRKRDAAANAVLALSFAANAAQSPQSLVSSGKDAAPGFANMQRLMDPRKKRKDLDLQRVSHSARNKTFREFIEEAKGSKQFPGSPATFSSREEGEKHHGGTPKGYYWNNSSRSETPAWRLKPSSGGKAEKERRKKRIRDLTHPDDLAKGSAKETKLKGAGLETHHITPLHYSAKIKASMSDAEWEARKKKDAASGIYHGHHHKNLMGATTSKTPESRRRRGIPHRIGGAHDVEKQTADLYSGSISHKDLLAAAQRRRLKKEKEAKK